MIIKIKREIEEMIEVKLPLYYQFGYSFIKILDENNYIEVKTDSLGVELRGNNHTVSLLVSKAAIITEMQFDELYSDAMKALLKACPVLSDEHHD